MKISIIAVVITAAFSFSANAATGTTYDSIQDARISSLNTNSNAAFQQINDNKVDQDAYNNQIATSLHTVDSKASQAKDTADAAQVVADRADQQSISNYVAISDEIAQRQRVEHDLQNQVQQVSASQQNYATQANVDKVDAQHNSRLTALENAPKPMNGKDGAKGDKGDTGAQGKQGLTGATGLNGKDGKAGINGRDGKNGVNGVASTVTKVQVDSATQSTVKRNSTSTASNAADLKAVHQALNKLSAANNNFSSLKDEVDSNKKEARSGSAAAVAIASMPQVEAGQTMMFSAGVGTFKSESALSVGASLHAGSNTVIKAGLSTTTNNDFAMGAGVGFGF
ncbi:YadA-like family protein [Pseudocitrobacter faecalis]|uniref:YadA C-terminal domain-containing protein n=1 Tax=Pseudocitrobacter faecalis TaxID=1398493 RepID=UPI003899DA5B